MSQRRFPPPWSVEELEACFVVRDHNGQALSYVYYEDEPGRRSAAKLLAIAGNVTKLSELLRSVELFGLLQASNILNRLFGL
jgi:hypothetical protein